VLTLLNHGTASSAEAGGIPKLIAQARGEEMMSATQSDLKYLDMMKQENDSKR